MNCKITLPIILVAFLAVTTGCQEAPGEFNLSLYGERYIEEGIPASNFDDGWKVSFSKFDVELSHLVLTPTDGGSPIQLTLDGGSEASHSFNLVNRSEGEGQKVVSADVKPGTYTLSFALGPIEIEGSGEKNDSIKKFDWKIDEVTGYEKCEVPIKIVSKHKTPFQITVHADHLFFNSISSESPKVLFHPYAYADENEDGTVTSAELNNAKELFGLDAGKFPVTSMADFLNLQARTIGHVNGETHCKKIVSIK